MPVTYVYHHTLEEGGEFGLNVEMWRFPVHPKKVMEMREHSPSCVCHRSQPPAAAEDILIPDIPSLDSSPAEPPCTNWAGRPPPCLPVHMPARKDQTHPTILSNCFNIWT